MHLDARADAEMQALLSARGCGLSARFVSEGVQGVSNCSCGTTPRLASAMLLKKSSDSEGRGRLTRHLAHDRCGDSRLRDKPMW